MGKQAVDADLVIKDLWMGEAPRPGIKGPWKHLVLTAWEIQPPDSAFPGMRVHRCHIDDSGPPVREDESASAVKCAAHVAHWVRKGEPVLVTCAMGRNRSGLVTALAIMFLTRASPADAVWLVRRARGPHALSNKSFVKLINRVGKSMGSSHAATMIA